MFDILLVEDDEFFRAAMKSVLTKNGFAVVEAPNGKSARDLINLRSFDLILADIQMPHFSGIELLSWVRESRPIPVILMTGFANILETQEAYRLGAAGFLAKPFSEAEMSKMISGILEKINPTNAEAAIKLEKDEKSETYYKLSIEDFVSGNQIPFSIYVNVGDRKYIKIAHRGEDLSYQKIKTYMEKNVRHLFIREEDFAALVGLNLQLSKSMKTKTGISASVKQKFARYTGEIILERAFVKGIDNVGFNVAKDFIENSMALFTQDDKAFTALNLLSEHSDFVYAHSLGVCTYATMVAKKIGWNSPQTLFKLCIGALFHDIGKKEIPRAVLETPRLMLSQQERKELEAHAQRGKEIVNTIESMPTEASHIIYEHHENVIGSGFPRAIRKDRIHPFARLVSVIDIFCNYAIKNPNSDGVTAAEAIQKMEVNDKEVLDKEFFSGLKKLAG